MCNSHNSGDASRVSAPAQALWEELLFLCIPSSKPRDGGDACIISVHQSTEAWREEMVYLNLTGREQQNEDLNSDLSGSRTVCELL